MTKKLGHLRNIQTNQKGMRMLGLDTLITIIQIRTCELLFDDEVELTIYLPSQFSNRAVYTEN